MSCKILITNNVQVDGKWFTAYEQHCYTDTNISAVDPCIVCTIETSDTTHVKHYKITVDEVDYWVPEYVLVDIGDSMIDPPAQDQFGYFRDKYQDTTTDYIKEVKEIMDIDIKKAYLPQHEGDSDKELMKIVKRNNYVDEREEGAVG